MTEDEKTKSIFMNVVQSLSFIFNQKPKNMYYVLKEVGSFDELLILALAASDMDLDIDEAYHLCKESEEIKEKMGEVIHLWKKLDSSAGTVNGS